MSVMQRSDKYERIVMGPSGSRLVTEDAVFGRSRSPISAAMESFKGVIEPIRFEPIKILITLSGWGSLNAAKQRLAIMPGAVFVIPPGAEFHSVAQDTVRAGSLYLRSDYVGDQLPWLPLAHPLVHHLRRAHAGETKFGRLQVGTHGVRELTIGVRRLIALAGAQGQEIALMSAAADLVHFIGRSAGAAGEGMPTAVPQNAVAEAVAALRADLRREWRIDDLAREVALSTSQLRRLFQRQLGISPAACLARLRVDHIAETLAVTGMSISEAAANAGWKSSAVAGRAFKRRYGVTPSTYASAYRMPLRGVTSANA